MKGLIRESQIDPAFRARVVALVLNCHGDEVCQIQKIHDFVKTNLLYIKEPDEILHDPRFLMAAISRGFITHGDCDDHVLLAGSMLRAIGIEADVWVVGMKADEFSHILLNVITNVGSFFIDTTQDQVFDPRIFPYSQVEPLD